MSAVTTLGWYRGVYGLGLQIKVMRWKCKPSYITSASSQILGSTHANSAKASFLCEVIGGAQQPAVYCGCLLLFSSQETIASYCFVKELRNRQEWCVVTYEHNAHLGSSHTRLLCVARLHFALGIIIMKIIIFLSGPWQQQKFADLYPRPMMWLTFELTMMEVPTFDHTDLKLKEGNFKSLPQHSACQWHILVWRGNGDADKKAESGRSAWIWRWWSGGRRGREWEHLLLRPQESYQVEDIQHISQMEKQNPWNDVVKGKALAT